MVILSHKKDSIFFPVKFMHLIIYGTNKPHREAMNLWISNVKFDTGKPFILLAYCISQEVKIFNLLTSL